RRRIEPASVSRRWWSLVEQHVRQAACLRASARAVLQLITRSWDVRNPERASQAADPLDCCRLAWDGRYWARTSDPQLPSLGPPSESRVLVRACVERRPN